MRIFLVFLIFLLIGFFFLQGRLTETTSQKPAFLKEDPIADKHQTLITVKVNSKWHPTDFEMMAFKKDYSNIWAHLNHLYATNDVEAGKEYYTEDWFKQICLNYEEPKLAIVTREDLMHKLYIKNWSSDGLVCTAIDSNVVLQYHYPNHTVQTKIETLAMVLLLQGDHWCLDAVKILNEKTQNIKQ